MANKKPSRVILWSTPRSVSTAFLKCMTFVERSIIWHEPYIFANRLAPDGTIKASIEKARMEGRTSELPLVAEYLTLKTKPPIPAGCTPENVYEASSHTFNWVKQQLEAPQTDTDLVFVKDMIHGITDHYDDIPDNFHHTFLMRHPLKVFDSYKRLRMNSPGMLSDLTSLPEMNIPSGYFFRELYDLFEYVKTHRDPSPVVIDADDLLRDPKGILSAYCKHSGIKYNDSLLQWPAGTDEIFKRWIIQKEVVCNWRVLEVFKKCFDSTCFGQPTQIPDRANLSPDVLQLTDACMPIYEKLYEQRLQVKKRKTINVHHTYKNKNKTNCNDNKGGNKR